MIEVWFLSTLRMQSRLFPCPLASGFCINIHIHRLYTGTGVRVVVQTRIENSDAFTNSKTKRFPCPNCTSAFGQKPSLTRHLRYECRQEPRFQCPYCQQRSKKTSDIYAHIRRKHANLKVFVIDIHGSIAHSSSSSFKIDRL